MVATTFVEHNLVVDILAGDGLLSKVLRHNRTGLVLHAAPPDHLRRRVVAAIHALDLPGGTVRARVSLLAVLCHL